MGADLLTLDSIQAVLDIDAGNSETLLRGYIRKASDLVVQYTGRSFVPLWQTRAYDACGEHVASRELMLDDDLLDVVTLTNGEGEAIDATAYLLVPYNDYPKQRIALKASAPATFTAYTDDWRAAIQVAGIWGFHIQWPDAWVDTLDTVQDDPLTAATTTLTVTDSAGMDARGVTPRFERLGYYRIEDEVVQALDVTVTPATDEDPAVHTLTIVRGQRGTTAADHAQGTAITRYLPMQDVEQAALSLASWLYRNKEHTGEHFTFLDGSQLVTNVAPSHIKETLKRYRRLRVE